MKKSPYGFLWLLIGEISVDEAAAQRGAMSAIVVNQDGHPGQGFLTC
jgi:hypothetical protein